MLLENSLSTSGNERTKNTMDGPVKHEAKKSKVKKKTTGDLKEYDNKREQLKVKQNPSTGVNSNKKSGNNLLMSGDDNTSNKFKYDRLNKAPYIVFVRKLGERNISKSISVIEASRLLTKANIKFKVIEPHAFRIHGKSSSIYIKKQMHRFRIIFFRNWVLYCIYQNTKS